MSNEHVNERVEKVAKNAGKWAELDDKKKLQYLKDAAVRVDKYLDEWGQACTKVRGYTGKQYLEGIGYNVGPGMTSLHLLGLIRTYESLVSTGKPPAAKARKVGDQVVLSVYPLSLSEKLVLPVDVDLWLEPGKEPTQGACRAKTGTCGILSAGNYEAPIDILTKMFVESKVCVYARHANIKDSNCFVEKIFCDLVKDGFLTTVDPGIPNASAVVSHEKIEEVLMTGGCATYDKIVWGDEDAKARGERRITKTVEAELGAVSPYIIAPSEAWSDKEVDHHAGALVGFKLSNSSAVCASPQLLVVSKNWSKRELFMQKIISKLETSLAVPIFYNGTQERCDAAEKAYSDVVKVNCKHNEDGCVKPIIIRNLTEADVGSYSMKNEAFAPVLVELVIDAPDVKTFMEKTRDIVNSDNVFGSLSCSVMLHPSVEKELGAEYVNKWLQSMEWGTTAVNNWGALGTFFPTGLWGAFPKHRPEDIQSGMGILGNCLMYDYPQKQVLRSPFKALGHPAGGPTQLEANVFKNVASYAANPGCWRLTKLAGSAVRAMLC
eukprot:TRINITY_DN15660_c2_g2_i1.p1 TRINITY_DN15660_c2_g2~~TRINITY_DN15660_c2_g2_i1.p1  ORF type:complete len:559 (+),score=211.55 TRINITY_DN15660_c2_g2_i1:31-1677(+)